MIVTIDNLDMNGVLTISDYVDASFAPRITRRLNGGSQLRMRLAASGDAQLTVKAGAKIWVRRNDSTPWFSGYVDKAPRPVYLGRGAKGNLYALELTASGEETALDRQPMPQSLTPIGGTAGAALIALTELAQPATYDETGVSDLAMQGALPLTPLTRWTEAATMIAGGARGCWRILDSKLALKPIGQNALSLTPGDGRFSPEALELEEPERRINDLTIIGEEAAGLYVKEYFRGDGATASFALSANPLQKTPLTAANEEYTAAPSPLLWDTRDDAGILSVYGDALHFNGIGGSSAAAWLALRQKLEMGGGWTLEHGAFSLAGSGMLGALYNSTPTGSCVAGFQLAGGVLSAVINGSAQNATTLAVRSGYLYKLTTRISAMETYSQSQGFTSSNARYAASLSTPTLRFVLTAQEINPSDPSTQSAKATVLYDGVAGNAPGALCYAVLNGGSLSGYVTYTVLSRTAAMEVRSTPNGGSARTRLLGELYEGAECRITSGPSISFHTPYIPAAGEYVTARYRASSRAMARVADADSIAAQARPGDSGLRRAYARLSWPMARTPEECRRAAMAAMDDAARQAVRGVYVTRTDFLPNGMEDIFPGDAINVNAPEMAEAFTAILREIEIEIDDTINDRASLRLTFANDAAEAITTGRREITPADEQQQLPALTRSDAAVTIIPLSGAEVIATTSTTATIDAGVTPASGGGVEVRSRGDWGWGTGDGGNLVGRFTTQLFTLPYTTKGEAYYLRLYDAATPRRYSAISTLLTVGVN